MGAKRYAGLGALLLGLAGCAGVCGRGDCGEGAEARAGYPRTVAPWAQPSDTGRYVGYAVGGGSPCKGDAPGPDEGTWGWDYKGLCLPQKVELLWYHGKEQGGSGAYAIDGPRPLEELHEKASEKKGE
jgi:hypothetical protein